MLDLCLCSIKQSALPSTNRLYKIIQHYIILLYYFTLYKKIIQQRLQRHKPIRHMKTKYEEQLQNSPGLFQRLWSVEDREGTNIRYLVLCLHTFELEMPQ